MVKANIKQNEQKETQEKKNAPKEYIGAVGRRRSAIARVRLYANRRSPLLWGEIEVPKGEIYVNKLPIGQYFSGDITKARYMEPLKVVNGVGKFTLTVLVSGGGKAGQLNAVVLGMARALSDLDRENFRSLLKKKGFLTRDPRVRERRKVGTGGKARRKKQSPKR